MIVGFIGLGKMGSAMVSRLLAAGHEVHVWNRSQQAVGHLVAAGAIPAASVQETAVGEALFTMLTDDASTREIVVGSGVLASAKPGFTLVNHATVSVDFARELARYCLECGTGFVCAPVFGRPDAVAAAEEKAKPLPFASILRDRFLESLDGDDSDGLDWSAIARR